MRQSPPNYTPLEIGGNNVPFTGGNLKNHLDTLPAVPVSFAISSIPEFAIRNKTKILTDKVSELCGQFHPVDIGPFANFTEKTEVDARNYGRYVSDDSKPFMIDGVRIRIFIPIFTLRNPSLFHFNPTKVIQQFENNVSVVSFPFQQTKHIGIMIDGVMPLDKYEDLVHLIDKDVQRICECIKSYNLVVESIYELKLSECNRMVDEYIKSLDDEAAIIKDIESKIDDIMQNASDAVSESIKSSSLGRKVTHPKYGSGTLLERRFGEYVVLFDDEEIGSKAVKMEDIRVSFMTERIG